MSETTQSADAKPGAFLPDPYNTNWREAYRKKDSDAPRRASYEAPPGGKPIFFIQNSFRFSGGQSVDTSEYPFGGLWSNEWLNEKPQSLTVEGYLRGAEYIAARNALIEALRVRTDDAEPGFLDLPFWGRFPVVVNDNYEISESADEQGQCTISISFTRVRDNTALTASPPSVKTETLKKAAADDFKVRNISALLAVFGKITGALQRILGGIQGAQTIMNTMINAVLGITNLINQGIRSPKEFVQALFNAGDAIVGGIHNIKSSIAVYDTQDNEKKALIPFLSADTEVLSEEAATASEEETIKACENLYRIMAFSVSVRLLENMDSLTYKKATGYWRLLEKLANSIDRENPAVYAAIQDILSALAQKLSAMDIHREMTRRIPAAAPLLYLANYLGCDEDKIRALNSVADSFVIEGDVMYV
jgi:hypothetical protein